MQNHHKIKNSTCLSTSLGLNSTIFPLFWLRSSIYSQLQRNKCYILAFNLICTKNSIFKSNGVYKLKSFKVLNSNLRNDCSLLVYRIIVPQFRKTSKKPSCRESIFTKTGCLKLSSTRKLFYEFSKLA